MPTVRQKRDNSHGLFHLAIMLFCLLVTSPAVPAGEVTLVAPVDFGSIDLNPGGDTIVIAAHNGPASPAGSRSGVTGGGSGLIQVTSTEAEHVEILFPDSAPLVCGSHSLTIKDIGPHSQYHLTGLDLPGGGVTRTISVGGSLKLQGDEASVSCSGFLSIQLNFF